ncbi:uncharacterized protein LOC143292000 [Babylonia areolata]|uniref:uncharacterized protein LOC143292000 n=1 Tax=Babylonia areolata TaxID=304850 RepID=UPI003FD5916A
MVVSADQREESRGVDSEVVRGVAVDTEQGGATGVSGTVSTPSSPLGHRATPGQRQRDSGSGRGDGDFPRSGQVTSSGEPRGSVRGSRDSLGHPCGDARAARTSFVAGKQTEMSAFLGNQPRKSPANSSRGRGRGGGVSDRNLRSSVLRKP